MLVSEEMKMLTPLLRQDLDVAITNMRFPVSDLLTCVTQLCFKEWQQLWNQCTSNFTVCNRVLVAVSVRHWAATTQSSSTVFELDIQDLQTLIS